MMVQFFGETNPDHELSTTDSEERSSIMRRILLLFLQRFIIISQHNSLTRENNIWTQSELKIRVYKYFKKTDVCNLRQITFSTYVRS